MRTRNLQPKFDGKKIADKRRERGLSQAELSDAVGLTRYQIIRIEKGESGSFDSLRTICRKLEMPMTDVFEADTPVHV